MTWGLAWPLDAFMHWPHQESQGVLLAAAIVLNRFGIGVQHTLDQRCERPLVADLLEAQALHRLRRGLSPSTGR